jgi:hypothetical protein
LREALRCNPFDVAGLAGTIEHALELDEGDRLRRIERMAATVARRDVYWWTEQELAAAGEARTAALAIEVVSGSGSGTVRSGSSGRVPGSGGGVTPSSSSGIVPGSSGSGSWGSRS